MCKIRDLSSLSDAFREIVTTNQDLYALHLWLCLTCNQLILEKNAKDLDFHGTVVKKEKHYLYNGYMHEYFLTMPFFYLILVRNVICSLNLFSILQPDQGVGGVS